ncbi:2-hydroxyacid dehydrogenase [Truepera radiovictrix]|uniref:D-isomer specific 2-hydroxyacid dehydrogenase NAD-binding protein n=1 Tax=Truepera radiovictrix (strain DSM 17093 / CIP 108686 / LMG 22925 / RQ-24) TaxID=649638 RepID=D7CXL7_TRURR|nr:2-hydroxyacid dehydrogenase [Truepera radiovictrix]ADI14619.1 D-isomer specific 2-hydroxyacid dehydrogenase NAD-binding protein [Truepera radiovictrix DSM 17093]WMT56831.1 2-hydroxyacid dehydrogenase [Truepera radiovictrix]
MDLAIFSTKPYDRRFFEAANAEHGHGLHFFEPRLTPETASLAAGFTGVCAFVNDVLSAPVLRELAAGGTKLIALRSAGFNHVDLGAAQELGLTVARVPAYSPYAVAEHALALILTLNRKTHRAFNRVREGNFALDGLLGFDLHGKTVGVVGTGKIGLIFARIAAGFGCEVLAYDPYPNPEARARYVPLPELLGAADIVSLHCPLTPETYHLIGKEAVAQMKPGAMLINTSRGALVDTRAVIHGLKSGQIGALGLDVYEEEADLFFEDLSDRVIQDDVFTRLLTFPNVLITGHQGFFTVEALDNIAHTTLRNVTAFETGAGELHRVAVDTAHA